MSTVPCPRGNAPGRGHPHTCQETGARRQGRKGAEPAAIPSAGRSRVGPPLLAAAAAASAASESKRQVGGREYSRWWWWCRRRWTLTRAGSEGGMNFRGFLVPASANLSGLRLSDPLVPHRIIACVVVAGPRHLGRTRHVGRGSYRIQLVRARTRFRDACTCVRARGTK